MKKMTKREKFEMLMAISEVNSSPVLSEFIAHELELLAKKNTSEKKPTAVQQANEVLKNAIVAGMNPDRLYTVTELIKEIPECNELSTSKVSALVNRMPERIERIPDKRKTYFRLITE